MMSFFVLLKVFQSYQAEILLKNAPLNPVSGGDVFASRKENTSI